STVRREPSSIPIYCENQVGELCFREGHLYPNDPLWQMDLLRRTVRGELSEIFGQATLGQDKIHRAFGFAGILADTATHLPANLSLAFNAYAQGVNAFIDSLNDQNLPPEFALLQYKPRHWTPQDSLGVGKLLAEYLSS